MADGVSAARSPSSARRARATTVDEAFLEYLAWVRSRGPDAFQSHYFQGLPRLRAPMLTLGYVEEHKNFRCWRHPECRWLLKRTPTSPMLPAHTAHYALTAAGKAAIRPHLVLAKLRDAHKAQR